MAEHGQSSSTWNDAEAKKLPEKVAEMKITGESTNEDETARKRLVIVGLGMVGISFM
jgi:nitrite reductase (NAD(P)H)